MAEPQNIIQRVPPWLEEDLLIKTVHEEVDATKFNNYYTMMCKDPKQPVQLWREHQITTQRKVEGIQTSDLTFQVTITNNGYEDVVPSFLISPTCCLTDYENVEITDGTNTIAVNTYMIGETVISPTGIINAPYDVLGFFEGTFARLKAKETKTYTFTFGAIYDTTPMTCSVYFTELTNYNLHVKTRAMPKYPIKSVEIFTEDGTSLKKVTYKQRECVVEDLQTIENVSYPRFYAEIGYHGFTSTKKKGFPQVAIEPSEESEKMYYKNDYLDDLAKTYGIFRRVYKTDIDPLDYLDTYPTAYPFDIEQDYWLEQRILGEYSFLYPTFGLLKAEIYGYLGVIPEVVDMTDNVLIYDRRTWDYHLWGGDDYMPAVFEVDIPADDIPANFNLLSMDELQSVIDRCKKVGTKGIPMYIRETEFPPMEMTFDVYSDRDQVIEAELSLEFEFDPENTISKRLELDLDIEGNPSEITRDLSLAPQFTLSSNGFLVKEALNLTDVGVNSCNLKNIIYNEDIEEPGLTLKTVGGLYNPNGSFITPSIIADSQIFDEWENFTTVETIGTNHTILYDVLTEKTDQEQLSQGDILGFGFPAQSKIMQIFTPQQTDLTNVQLIAGPNQGTPTGDVIVSINTVDDNNNPSQIPLQKYTLSSWSGIHQIPFDISGLTVGTKYAIVITAEVQDLDNYYTLVAKKDSSYGGNAFTFNGSAWLNTYGAITFVTSYPITLKTDQLAPIPLSDITQTIIKIRGKMTSSDSATSPIVHSLKADYLQQLF